MASQARAVPVRGVFAGVSLTIVMLGICAIFPLALIPTVILGPAAIWYGLRARMGDCPNCGSSMPIVGKDGVYKCKACRHRIKVDHHAMHDVT